jgi:hypothetical protein
VSGLRVADVTRKTVTTTAAVLASAIARGSSLISLAATYATRSERRARSRRPAARAAALYLLCSISKRATLLGEQAPLFLKSAHKALHKNDPALDRTPL